MTFLSARDCSLTIWNAGVDAVRAEQLVKANVELRSQALSICHVEYPIDELGKICVVGAGKAAGYLAAAIEELLDPVADQLRLHGCVNVPANCLPPTIRIELHAGRPANVNEPTAEGVVGTKKILQLVSSLESNDLCLCLLTGGGSALLPAPAPGISLEDKLSVTRLLSSNGASIQQLNRVRTAMSSIKGGGLSRACTAGKLVSLIVSDVIGDPLDLIASGPTVCDATSGERELDILRRFVSDSDLSLRLWRFFQDLPAARMGSHDIPSYVRNHLLANNMSAVNAAVDQARSMGLSVEVLPPEPANASAEDVARQLVDHLRIPDLRAPTCLIWGGEPIVRLSATEHRGLGGRNQQLVLAALSEWDTLPSEVRERLCILSAGTDGEDGPTDAAGAFVDQAVVNAMVQRGLRVDDYLQRNNAYAFFDALNALHRTGPTHTNVCDLRVAVLR